MIEVAYHKFGEKVIDSHGNVDFRDQCFVDASVVVDQRAGQFNTVELLSTILATLMSEWKIYFVYSESIATNKSKIKSHKKLFFKERKATLLSDREIFETEIDVGSSKSIVTSIISPKKEDSLNFVVNNLLDDRLKFIFIVRKGKRSFKMNRSVFLRTMLSHKFENVNSIILDKKKIAATLVNDYNHLLKINWNVNDKDVIDIISKDGAAPGNQDIYAIIEEYRVSKLN